MVRINVGTALKPPQHQSPPLQPHGPGVTPLSGRGSKKYTSSLNSEEHQHIQLLLIRQKRKIGGGMTEGGEKEAGQWEGNWDKGKRNYMARFYRAQLRGPITLSNAKHLASSPRYTEKETLKLAKCQTFWWLADVIPA